MAAAANNMLKRNKLRYTAEYLVKALLLAERVGVAAAVSQFLMQVTQTQQWRGKAAHDRSVSDREGEYN